MASKKKRPSTPKITLLLVIAAPLLVPSGDQDRLEQAGMFVAKELEAEVWNESAKVPKGMLDDTFWAPAIEARRSFEDMAFVISNNLGWGLESSRRVLAEGIKEYITSPQRSSLLVRASVIDNLGDPRLSRWCLLALAKSMQEKGQPSKETADDFIDLADRYVRTGDKKLLQTRSLKDPSIIDDIETRQETFDVFEDATWKYEEFALEYLRDAIEELDPEFAMQSLFGAPALELAWLSWQADFVKMKPVQLAARIFAYGMAYKQQIDDLPVDNRALQKTLNPGYERAIELFVEALFTLPPRHQS